MLTLYTAVYRQVCVILLLFGKGGEASRLIARGRVGKALPKEAPAKWERVGGGCLELGSRIDVSAARVGSAHASHYKDPYKDPCRLVGCRGPAQSASGVAYRR